MRFSPTLFLGVLAIVAAGALAVPLVISPQRISQSSVSEPLEESLNGENPSLRRGGRRAEILQNLNLTRSQFNQLAAIRRRYQPLLRERTLTVRTAQGELRRLLASAATESEVKAQFQQMQQQRQELQRLRFESVLAMRQILTPAQRQTFEAALEKQRSSRRDRS
jgi:periplasmic protein CpxP/Spy